MGAQPLQGATPAAMPAPEYDVQMATQALQESVQHSVTDAAIVFPPPTSVVELQRLMEAPVVIAQGMWSTDDPQDTILDEYIFPHTLLEIPNIQRLLQGFRYLQYEKVRLEIHFTAPVSYIGAMLLAGSQYSGILLGEMVGITGTTIPHLIHDASAPEILVLEIPYINNLPYYDLQSWTPEGTDGLQTAVLSVFHELHATAAAFGGSHVTYHVKAQFINPQVFFRTGQEHTFTSASKSSKRRAQIRAHSKQIQPPVVSHGFADILGGAAKHITTVQDTIAQAQTLAGHAQEAMQVISNPSVDPPAPAPPKHRNWFSRLFHKIPILGGMADGFVNGISKVQTVLPLLAGALDVEPDPTIPEPAYLEVEAWCGRTKMPVQIRALQYDQKVAAETGAALGGTTEDEMAIKTIAMTPSLIHRRTFAATDTAWDIPTNPWYSQGWSAAAPDLPDSIHEVGHLQYLAMNFAYVMTSMHYLFIVHSHALMHGIIQIKWFPPGSSEAAEYEPIVARRHIEVTGTQTFKIMIPYPSNHFMTPNPLFVDTLSVSTFAALSSAHGVGGHFEISWLNGLVGPGEEEPQVAVTVYAAAGPDCVFQNPIQIWGPENYVEEVSRRKQPKVVSHGNVTSKVTKAVMYACDIRVSRADDSDEEDDQPVVVSTINPVGFFKEDFEPMMLGDTYRATGPTFSDKVDSVADLLHVGGRMATLSIGAVSVNGLLNGAFTFTPHHARDATFTYKGDGTVSSYEVNHPFHTWSLIYMRWSGGVNHLIQTGSFEGYGWADRFLSHLPGYDWTLPQVSGGARQMLETSIRRALPIPQAQYIPYPAQWVRTPSFASPVRFQLYAKEGIATGNRFIFWTSADDFFRFYMLRGAGKFIVTNTTYLVLDS